MSQVHASEQRAGSVYRFILNNTPASKALHHVNSVGGDSNALQLAILTNRHPSISERFFPGWCVICSTHYVIYYERSADYSFRNALKKFTNKPNSRMLSRMLTEERLAARSCKVVVGGTSWSPHHALAALPNVQKNTK